MPALQVMGLALLSLMLIPVFSGSKGLLLPAGLFGLCGLLLLFFRPDFGILMILLSWFVQVPPFLGVAYLSIPYTVAAVLVVPLLLTMHKDRGLWIRKVPAVRFYLAIAVCFILSTWWNQLERPILPELDQTPRLMQLFFARFAFLVLFLYFINTRRRIENVVVLMLMLIFAAALSALPDFLKGGPGHLRAAATFSMAENANRLAYICAFAISFVWFYRFYAPSGTLRRLTTPVLGVLGFVALAAGSRSGLLQMITFAVLILREQRHWPVTKRVRSIAFVTTLGFLLISAMPAFQLERMTTFDPSRSAPGQQSLQNRANTIVVALGMLASNPFLGVGIGNFKLSDKETSGTAGSPHNSYLWSALSGGILALVFYLLIYQRTYRTLQNLERVGPRELLWLAKALRVNLVLFLIFSAFADFWLSPFPYVIIGLTTAMAAVAERSGYQVPAVRMRAAA